MSVRRTRMPRGEAGAAGGGWTNAVRVTLQGGAQTIPHVTETAISFDTQQFDTDNMWVIGSPTRITFQTAGKYAVGFFFVIDEAADTTSLLASILLNGSDYIFSDSPNSLANAQATSLSGQTVWDFASSDYVETVVYQAQSVAGTADVLSDSSEYPQFWAYRIG